MPPNCQQELASNRASETLSDLLRTNVAFLSFVKAESIVLFLKLFAQVFPFFFASFLKFLP